MLIIVGCDFHPSYQQIAFVVTESGEIEERSLTYSGPEAEQFYRRLGRPALIGMESVGNSQWFVSLLDRSGHEVWIGDAAKIRASYVRHQKTDRRDVGHILKLLLEGRFPLIWAPCNEMRDHGQFLVHQYKLVPFHSGMYFVGRNCFDRRRIGVAHLFSPSEHHRSAHLEECHLPNTRPDSHQRTHTLH